VASTATVSWAGSGVCYKTVTSLETDILVPNFELFIFISDFKIKILISLFKIKIPVEVTGSEIKIISSHKVEAVVGFINFYGESTASEFKPEHGSQAKLLNGDHFK
jgi:hypothetical protein